MLLGGRPHLRPFEELPRGAVQTLIALGPQETDKPTAEPDPELR